jgi:hypothetical protein
MSAPIFSNPSGPLEHPTAVYCSDVGGHAGLECVWMNIMVLQVPKIICTRKLEPFLNQVATVLEVGQSQFLLPMEPLQSSVRVLLQPRYGLGSTQPLT